MYMDSCMHAYSTVQQLLCHGSSCELILSLARTSCRLLFTVRPTIRPLASNPLRDAVRSRNPSKSTLAQDAVATVVLHKHHPIIHVGAGLIQFVYRSHLRLARRLPVTEMHFCQFSREFFYNMHQSSRCITCMHHLDRFHLIIPEIGILSSEIKFRNSCFNANWVSFDFNVSYSSCWGYSLINTLKLKNLIICTWHVRVPEFVKFRSIHFNFSVPERYAYLLGTWKMKMAKPKVKGTPTVGLNLKIGGLYRGDGNLCPTLTAHSAPAFFRISRNRVQASNPHLDKSFGMRLGLCRKAQCFYGGPISHCDTSSINTSI